MMGFSWTIHFQKTDGEDWELSLLDDSFGTWPYGYFP
jgi:hypothetical protein